MSSGRNNKFGLALIGLLCLVPSRFDVPRAAEVSDPVAVLKSAMAPPSVSYRGRLWVTRWFGKHTRDEEVLVSFRPPNRYRWEFLAPDEQVARVVASDGKTERIYLPKQNRALQGAAIHNSPRSMSPDQELDLLLKNYDLSIEGTEKIVGRPAWVLALTPRARGKHTQRLWIDKQTRIILANKRFKRGGKFAAFSRFSQFETARELPDNLFEVAVPSDAVVDEHGLDSGLMSMEDLNQVTGKPLRLPQELPGGFSFESAGYFPIRSETVRQFGYTDGLCTLSIFVTDRPVRLPKNKESDAADADSVGSLHLSSAGRVLHWKSGRLHFTMIGDVSQQLLQQIASFLNEPANFSEAHP